MKKGRKRPLLHLQEGETFLEKVVSLGAAILFLRKYKEKEKTDQAMNSKGMGPRVWGSLSLVDTMWASRGGSGSLNTNYKSYQPVMQNANPYVFGSPVSGSVSAGYGSGSGSFHHQAKK